jgi:hypothetical protein
VDVVGTNKTIEGILHGRNWFQWGAELKKLGVDFWNYEGDLHLYKDKNGKWRFELRK